MCGIFGFVDYGDAIGSEELNILFRYFAEACVIRGAHASGISYIRDGSLKSMKEPNKITEATFTFDRAKTIMAHCRLSTQENQYDNKNNHPFRGETGDGTKYDLMHNGILADLNNIRNRFTLNRPDIQTDSYCAVQLLNKEETVGFKSLKNMCGNLRGSFTISILDDIGNLYLCRGDVPVFVVHFKKIKLYAYISTRDLFEKAIQGTCLEKPYKTSNPEVTGSPVNIIHLNKGDILRLDGQGKAEKSTFSFHDESAIKSNWYLPGLRVTPELTEQLAHLNND